MDHALIYSWEPVWLHCRSKQWAYCTVTRAALWVISTYVYMYKHIPIVLRSAMDLDNPATTSTCKPARQFKDQWLTAFPWLLFEEGKMFCTVCTSQEGTSGQFVDGSTSFRRYSLSHHAERYISTGLYTIESIYYLPENNSIQHKSCMHTLSGHTSNAEHAVMQRLALLFRNAHAIAKAGRPFSDMEWMCALDEKKGLDVGASYRTDKKCCEFIHCIAEEQRLGLQAQLQSNNFFSVMMDGTTDSSVSDAEIIYIRYTGTLLVIFSY